MKKQSALQISVAALVFATGCATNHSTNNAVASPPVFSHPREITNPYLPLASLNQDNLQNEHERVERTAKPDVHRIFQVGGQTIEALAVEDREFDSSDNLTEATLDYFEQDDDGIEEIAPTADPFMQEHFGEAHKDLNNMLAGKTVQ